MEQETRGGHRATEELSRREREILKHLARGSTNPEIARELCISTRTVSAHVSNILRKLGVRNRLQAVIAAAAAA